MSIPQQLIMAQTMLTGTQKSKLNAMLMRKAVENKTKPLIMAKGSSYAIMDLLITRSFQLYVPLLVILQLLKGDP